MATQNKFLRRRRSSGTLPDFNWKVLFIVILFIEMYANFLKFELETLSDRINVETTSFKFWQKNSPIYYVKKIFLEGYRIINKIIFDVIDRLYVKTLHI